MVLRGTLAEVGLTMAVKSVRHRNTPHRRNKHRADCSYTFTHIQAATGWSTDLTVSIYFDPPTELRLRT